jgi:hypothetical protein
MAKLLSTFGFFIGLGLLAVAFLNPPSVGALQAREEIALACRTVDVPVDEGYGITEVVSQQVCGAAAR